MLILLLLFGCFVPVAVAFSGANLLAKLGVKLHQTWEFSAVVMTCVISLVYIFASSAEFVGEFWLGEFAKGVV